MDYKDYKETVRQYIFNSILESGLTQNQFAKRHNIDPSLLSKVLRGERVLQPGTIAKYFPNIPSIKWSIDRSDKYKRKSDIIICPFNEGVDCDEPTKCQKCGWNPVIMGSRIEKYRNSTQGTKR